MKKHDPAEVMARVAKYGSRGLLEDSTRLELERREKENEKMRDTVHRAVSSLGHSGEAVSAVSPLLVTESSN